MDIKNVYVNKYTKNNNAIKWQLLIMQLFFLEKATMLSIHRKKNHDQFVVAPIDKVSGNVLFNFKRFYLVVILKELGISRNEKTKYIEIRECQDFVDQEIINKHLKYIKNNVYAARDEAN